MPVVAAAILAAMNSAEIDIEAVWCKGREVEGYDSTRYRQDACGAWMKREEFGNAESMYGWEIDRIVPRSFLMTICGVDICSIRLDCIDNLRPMNCANNMAKKNDFPIYRSAITADGNRNVYKAGVYRVSMKLLESIISNYKGEK